MASMSALRAYKAAEYELTQRLLEKRRLESKAMRGWQESNGHDGMLKEWTDAIAVANDTASALYYIQTIIKEIESK